MIHVIYIEIAKKKIEFAFDKSEEVIFFMNGFQNRTESDDGDVIVYLKIE